MLVNLSKPSCNCFHVCLAQGCQFYMGKSAIFLDALPVTSISQRHNDFCTPVLSCVVVGHAVKLAWLPSVLGLRKSPKIFPWGSFHPACRVTILILPEDPGSPPDLFLLSLFDVSWGSKPCPPPVLCW